MKPTLIDEELINQSLSTSDTDNFDMLFARYVHAVHKRYFSLINTSKEAQALTRSVLLRNKASKG